MARNIAMFSGGKDSTALLIYLTKKGVEFEAVFCNTGWELPETIEYIKYIKEGLLGGKLTVLQNGNYKGMKDLIKKKDYIPTVHQRFCTDELKIKPVYAYIKKYGDGVVMFNGVRKAESLNRAKLVMSVWDDVAGCWLWRPLLNWTDNEVMNYISANGYKINPLYKKGMKRVGCGPCIMISLKELAVLVKTHPERIDEIREIERATGQTYFLSKMIPERFRTHISSQGNLRGSMDDIINYLDSKPKYFEIGEQANESCMSYYNLCE
jgi:3'-phosphoadenosine 5'-phosphosulfate sulfotransferase (PAPS reductase)/FAD synthetase